LNFWLKPFGLRAHNDFLEEETTLNTSSNPSVFQTQNNFKINAKPAEKVDKMFKSKYQSGLEMMLNECKTMTSGEFLVFFNPLELVKIL
jgi:hypothetical protein